MKLWAKYKPSPDQIDRIVANFTHHPPNQDQVERYQVIRSEAEALAGQLMVLCLPSRELSLAQTKLEEVVMWANAAIARNERPGGEAEAV